jgi:hypothetical protein
VGGWIEILYCIVLNTNLESELSPTTGIWVLEQVPENSTCWVWAPEKETETVEIGIEARGGSSNSPR